MSPITSLEVLWKVGRVPESMSCARGPAAYILVCRPWRLARRQSTHCFIADDRSSEISRHQSTIPVLQPSTIYKSRPRSRSLSLWSTNALHDMTGLAGPHVTRFTSLCPFGTVTKQNLFALCLTPAQFMESETLCEIPSDATHCPFHVPSDGKRTTDAEVKKQNHSTYVGYRLVRTSLSIYG